MKIKKMLYSMIGLVATFLFATLFSFQKVDAIYTPELNGVKSYSVDRGANSVSIEVEYQYGMTDLQIYLCDTSATGSAIDEYSSCVNTGFITKYVDGDLMFVVEDGVEKKVVINKKEGTVVYGKTYSTVTAGLPINLYTGKYDEMGKLNSYSVISLRKSI